MLQSYFSMGMARHIQFRKRDFHDSEDLRRWCAEVAYIAEPVVAAGNATTTVEINPGDTLVSEIVDLRIRGRAKDTFEAVWTLLTG